MDAPRRNYVDDPIATNLRWFDTVDQRGCWLAIPLAPQSKTNFERVTEFARQEIQVNEKLKSYTPYSFDQSHISLFVGFAENVPNLTKQAAMRKIAKKLAQLDLPKTLTIDSTETSIVRGPGPWVTMHFDAPILKTINDVIKSCLNRLVEKGELKEAHLYKTENLRKDLAPHLTLGKMDVKNPTETVWEKQDTDVKGLANASHREEFQRKFQAYKTVHRAYVLDLSQIQLMGIGDKVEKLKDKHYPVLARIEMNKPPVNPPKPKQGLLAPAPAAASKPQQAMPQAPAPTNSAPKGLLNPTPAPSKPQPAPIKETTPKKESPSKILFGIDENDDIYVDDYPPGFIPSPIVAPFETRTKGYACVVFYLDHYSHVLDYLYKHKIDYSSTQEGCDPSVVGVIIKEADVPEVWK